MFRQGDVLIKPVSSLPKDVKKVESNILVYGEVTGHSHKAKGADVYKTKDGALFLMVADKGFIVHEEHKPITLKKGTYAIIRQREYTMNNMTKLVVD
jgi:hypothetical protein